MTMPKTNFSHVFMLNGVVQITEWEWYLSLVGYIFGHSSFEHLLGNMSLLLILGPIIELKYGTQRFVFMSILTAFITGLLHTLLWDNGLLGFSGLVFMYIVLSTLLNIRNREVPFTFILVVVLYFGMEIISSLKDTQISHSHTFLAGQWAHFGAFQKGKVYSLIVELKNRSMVS